MTLRLSELVITLALVVIVIAIIESFNRFHGIGFTLRERVLESMGRRLGIEITTGAVRSRIPVLLLPFNPLSSPYNINLALHNNAFEPNMMDQIGSFGPSIWVQPEHRVEKGGYSVSFRAWKEVFVPQDSIEWPESEFINVSEFTWERRLG